MISRADHLRTPDIAEIEAEFARHRRVLACHDELVAALESVRDLEPVEYVFPADWSEQIAACHECQGWAKNHPIQRGICDTHRKPLWERDAHDERERKAIGWRARRIARDALDALARAKGEPS